MDDLPSNRLRLLVVENDRVTARDLEATLRRRGFCVLGIAYSTGQALDFLDGEKPDLVLLDVHLDEPDDGIDLARRLREEHGIPVVFVTGYSEEAVLERARAVEPAAVLRKPFSDAELAVCLESVVERRLAGERLSLRLPGLEAVSQQLSHAVFATNLDGGLVYVNQAALDLTGWSAPEALRSRLSVVAPLREASSDGGEAPKSGRRQILTRRDGSEVEVGERSVPIRAGDGEAVGLVTVLAPSVETDEGAPLEAFALAEPPESPSPEPAGESAAEPAPPVVFPPSQPPAARSEALRKIASIARDPAFRELIVKRKADPAAGSEAAPQGAGSESVEAAAVPEKPGNGEPSVLHRDSGEPTAEFDVGTVEASSVADAPSAPPSVEAAARLLASASGTAGGAVVAPDSAAQIEEVGDPLLRIDEDGVIRYANSEADSVFAAGSRLVGDLFRSLFDQEEFDRYEEHFLRPLRDGRRHRFDFHDSSRGMWFEVRAYPAGDGLLALFTDITATRLESAEQLRQQRLEGLGLLARGFAHDFNNSLTALTGNISLARERHPDDAELQAMLEEAQTAASKATGLVQQLMTFARGGRPIRERTRVPDLIRRILTEQRLRHPEIRYQFQGGDTDVVGNIDPAQIGRLVENLVVNSAAAMPNGGVLIVRCARLSPEEVLGIRRSHTPAEEDHLLIEIIDTGHGMSDQDLERVFEPYFTTRRENNATGIGLTVCESIAKAHGGFIQLQSKEGKGTIATFCAPLGRATDGIDDKDDAFPAYPNFDIPILQSTRGSDEGEPLLVGTRVLVLEDDAPIRRLMAATLRRAGHEVVETKDGRETIAVYSDALSRGERFDLLICDLTIENGMGGVETMRHLLQIDPEILAIVSSGYSDAPAMSNPAAFGFKGVLPKPYAPTELRACVHRILSAHRIIP